MEIYLHLNGEKRGPFSEERVRALLTEGIVALKDLGSEGSEGNWQPLSSFAFLARETPSSANVASPIPSPSVVAQPAHTANGAPPPPDRSLGSYARSTLTADESPIFKTSVHWIIFIRSLILGLVLFFFVAMPFAIAVQALLNSEMGWFALPLPALILLSPAVVFASSELVITNRRVLIKTGAARRQTLEMFISKIESVGVDQSFLGRFFDYGTVVIRGTGGSEEHFETIARPIQFRNAVQRVQGIAESVLQPR